MTSRPRMTSKELMLKTEARGSMKRKKEPDRDKEVVFYYFPSEIFVNVPFVMEMLKKKVREIGTENVTKVMTNEESHTVVESPVMVRDLVYSVRHEVCQMLNTTRTLGGDFKTLAGALGMTTQNIEVISKLENPANEVLVWWETRRSATMQTLRLKLLDMHRDDIIEVLEKDQEPAVEVHSESCSDQLLSEEIGEQIQHLNFSSFDPGNDVQFNVFLIGEILEVLVTRGLMKKVKIEQNLQTENPVQRFASGDSEVSCAGEAKDIQESIVTREYLELQMQSVKQLVVKTSAAVALLVATGCLIVLLS